MIYFIPILSIVTCCLCILFSSLVSFLIFMITMLFLKPGTTSIMILNFSLRVFFISVLISHHLNFLFLEHQ